MIDGIELGYAEALYTAGTAAPPGRYRRLDGPPREVELAPGGALPPSFDGRVALYVRLTERPSQLPDERVEA